MGWATAPPGGIRRVVSKLVVLDQMPEHIHPEAIHAAPANQKRSTSCMASTTRGLRQFEVRLLLEEGVVVVLAGAPHPAPRHCRRTG